MILKLRLDNERKVIYVVDSTSHLGGYDMWTITLADGTTYFPRNGEEAVRVFNSEMGKGATIRYQKEKVQKTT